MICFLACVFLFYWIRYRESTIELNNNKIQIYKERLRKYEDTTIIESIIDSLEEDYKEQNNGGED
jgi:hypothetical protein